MKLLKKYLCKKELLLGLFLLLVGWPLGFYNPIDFIPKASQKIHSTIMSVGSFFTAPFPLWGTLILISLAFFSKNLWQYAQNKHHDDNNFLQYREDVFNDVKYKWRYKRSKKQYAIVDIQAYCSDCGCQLPILECPNPECNKVYLEKPMGAQAVQKLIALIRYRLENVYNIDEYEKIQ